MTQQEPQDGMMRELMQMLQESDDDVRNELMQLLEGGILDDDLNEEEQAHGHSLKDSMGPRHFFGAVPVFLVDDITATCEYYQCVLGFEVDFSFGEPATFACVSRNNAMINLNLAEPGGALNSARRAGDLAGSDAFLVVSDLDDVYEELESRGARILGQPLMREYGMREFQLEDCNGYRLTLAEGLFQ